MVGKRMESRSSDLCPTHSLEALLPSQQTNTFLTLVKQGHWIVLSEFNV